MIYNDSSLVIWKSEFRPRMTTPKSARSCLNSVIRSNFEMKTGRVVELIRAIHSLTIIIDDLAIVSTCGNYVATPAFQGATLAVEIRECVTNKSQSYMRAEAWADAIKRHREEQEQGSFSNE